MKNGGGAGKDRVLALIIAAFFIAAYYANMPFVEKLEHLAYDTGVNLTFRNPGATGKVAIVAIDDASIERIGRWPWPRDILAEMLENLSKARAKVIGMQIFLTEPQTDPGLRHIRKIKEYVDEAKFPSQARRQAADITRMLIQAEQQLDADGALARTIPKTRNLFMPMFFTVGEALGNPEAPLPEFVRRNRLTRTVQAPGPDMGPYPTLNAKTPLAEFGENTAGVGHISFFRDADGGVRTEPLLLEHYGEYYPSLALLMAARSLNLKPRNLEAELGQGMRLGKLYIKTDAGMLMHTGFYPSRDGVPPFSTYSFHEVRSGAVPASVFRDKIVIIGSTATGVGSTYVTPVSSAMSAPELTANTITSILNQDFYTRPEWTLMAEPATYLVLALYLIFILPRMGAGLAAFVSFILLAGLVASSQYFMVSQKIWFKAMGPALFLVAGHLLLTTRRFFATERLKAIVETDSAQSNRMLGLAFQSQGQLDMAMDKFRKLPVDDSVLDLVYSLALDYERKRQFAKAASAYDYILQHDKKFRDVVERRKRANQAEGTVIIGGARGGANATMILEGVDQKPTLGRYEVEKELGKGAMGTVYLGRDPKINRVVAIKTMALSEEFEGNELESVKERFFREAETAGRLNHPDIVTIYDAGEEHDLAYIAMEYLQGKDLTHYISPTDLLDPTWVLEQIHRVALALDYAHKQDVVHRDIKPANIMYDENTDTLKVTDFGIARITASSKTKTGVVLGTPSYMSPEQLAGKKVDGRSDLFSLGVMMYEMLTAEQPFTGDSMAALMYQIANKKQKDITRVRDDLPACCRTIIDRALQKEPDKRYQSGEEMAQSIDRCLGKL